MKDSSRRTALGTIALVALASGSPIASARPVSAPSITLVAPWTRATSARAPMGAGYLVIRNAGGVADRLLSIATPVADSAQLHSMSVTNGIMRMRPIAGGVVVPAHGEARLAPGGDHIMFVGLKRPFVAGTEVPATLRFARAGTVAVRFKVERPGVDHGGMH